MPFIISESRDSKVKCSCVWLVVRVAAHDFHIECGSFGGYHIYMYVYTQMYSLRYLPFLIQKPSAWTPKVCNIMSQSPKQIAQNAIVHTLAVQVSTCFLVLVTLRARPKPF